MPKQPEHIIQTMCFEIQANAESAATAFGDKLESKDYSFLLNKVLTKYDDIKQEIYLDRLEFDLGELSETDMDFFDQLFMEKLQESIDRSIDEKVHKGLTFMDYRDSQLEHVTTVSTDIALLLHFFNTGSLPWNIIDKPDIEQLFVKLMQENAAELKQQTLPQLKKQIVVKRMLGGLRFTSIKDFIKLVLSSSDWLFVNRMNTAFELIMPAASKQPFNIQIAALFLEAAGRTHTKTDAFINCFFQLLETRLQEYPPSFLQGMFEKLKIEKQKGEKIQAFVYTELYAVLKKITMGNFELQKFPKKIEGLNQTFEKTRTENALKSNDVESNNNPDPDIHEDLEKNEDNENQQDIFFVDNAGLVLLNAALLQKSFEQLGWVKEKQIVGEEARNKMLCWLDYLIWGNRKVQEYGLTLNKVLVGMHPTGIAEINVTLSEAEMKMADDVLLTIIQHWASLKNTSIQGLRQTFLQRNAKLKNEDGGWQLYVESKAYDILIDKLPWSFSIIKFPWMEKPIYTQWHTKI